MPCVVCNGVGCDACGDTGETLITQCPHKELDHDTIKTLQFCQFAVDGQMPVEGGVLNQTQWFLDMLSFYKQEKDHLDRQTKIV